jgi:hypothetical protein
VLGFSLPATARAADCPSLADYAYNGACGPEFEMPAWGDGAGWTDPSKYTTIQLADLTGNGVDELIARNDDGLEIWTFDTTVGQWRPAIGKNGKPEVLTDFHSPLPSASGPNWTEPQYYSTIQTAQLDSPVGGADIIARFPDGIRVYRYQPPAGSQSIEGGSWSLVSQKGPFSDAEGYTAPSSYLTIHAIGKTSERPAEIAARTPDGDIVVYDWTGSGWIKNSAMRGWAMDANPAHYLSLRWVRLEVSTPEATLNVPALVFTLGYGMITLYQPFTPTGFWSAWASSDHRPFADFPNNGADCSYEDYPAHGCFASSPSYYETLRFANVVASDAFDQRTMLARLSDGLHVYQLSADEQTWQPLPTLTDLRGTTSDQPPLSPGRWASIRTGDILSNGRDQVLALDGKALQAWSYAPTSNAWTKLSPSQPLLLGGDMWDNNPSYYSTIRVGRVTPGGGDAVIARGPFGIRTWFYDLHGNSGWTSYLPTDTSSYPQFSGGQAAAFGALTSQAKSHGAIPSSDTSVRDVWTGENAASRSALDALRQTILGFAGCSGGTDGNPPFTMCTPPLGSAGFTAADWTAVVNEALNEIGLADAVDDFFTTLNTVRQKMFIVDGAELDGIAQKLGLQGATDNQMMMVSGFDIMGTILKILGAIVAAVPGGEAAGAALTAVGELAGLVASDSKTLTSEFPAKYADLKEKFADMVTEIDKGLEVQSQEVRSSYGLMSLIAKLTAPGGAWSDPDTIGLESVNDQGFALWVYQQLLPTLYVRYHVTNCDGIDKETGQQRCMYTGSTYGVYTGATSTSPDFALIGLPPVGSERPCRFEGGYCNFEVLPTEIATKVWGPLSETCDYKPGNPNTKWAFNSCNVGVNRQASMTLEDGPANGWDFQDYCGDPLIFFDSRCPSVAGSATVGGGQVALGGTLTLPPRFEVKSATIVAGRLLYEPAGPDGGAAELVDRASGRALGAVRLLRHGTVRAFTSRTPRARLTLRTERGGQVAYHLTLTAVKVRVPSACQALPVSDSLVTPPFELTSTLRLRDGSKTDTVSLPAVWRCVRDRAGLIAEMLPVHEPGPAQRPGLAVRLSGPTTVTSGSTVTYGITARNTRRGPRDRDVSSLWHLALEVFSTIRPTPGGTSTLPRAIFVGRLPELRRGRSRTMLFRVHIPSTAAGSFCVGVVGDADSARPASSQLCRSIVP